MAMLPRRAFLRQAARAGAGVLLAPLYATMQRARAAYPQLQITAIEPYIMDLDWQRLFVLVRTSGGVTGLGEASPMLPHTQVGLLGHMEYLLRGRNPLDVQRCWDAVFYPSYKQGPAGLLAETLAGVDIALWDILGKVAGLPVSQLLGGRRRDAVRVYASIGGGAQATPQEMAERAEAAVRQGFTAVKIRMGHGPVPPDAHVAHDLATLQAVRAALGPETELLYDVNNGYSVPTAIRVGRALEELGVVLYEEPLAQTNYEGYAQVAAALDVPVSAGEHEYTRWQFKDLIEQANPDVLQPDVVKCAGLSEAVKIAALASAHHKPLVPHQTQPTIGQAANLHYVSAFVAEDSAQELASDALGSPLQDLFGEPFTLENGRLRVPDDPGLGLTLDEAKMRALAL